MLLNIFTLRFLQRDAHFQAGLVETVTPLVDGFSPCFNRLEWHIEHGSSQEVSCCLSSVISNFIAHVRFVPRGGHQTLEHLVVNEGTLEQGLMLARGFADDHRSGCSNFVPRSFKQSAGDADPCLIRDVIGIAACAQGFDVV
jgi:hypothetical protein